MGHFLTYTSLLNDTTVIFGVMPVLSLIKRLSRPRAFLLLLGAYVVVFGLILYHLGQLQQISGHGILDFEQGYSPARVNEVLGSYGTDGMAIVRRIQLLDLINPALYSLILAVLTHWVWRGGGGRYLPLVALLGGVGDYAENVTLFLMLRAYPDIPPALVETSSALSLAKTGLLILSVLPLVIGLVIWLRTSRKG